MFDLSKSMNNSSFSLRSGHSHRPITYLVPANPTLVVIPILVSTSSSSSPPIHHHPPGNHHHPSVLNAKYFRRIRRGTSDLCHQFNAFYAETRGSFTTSTQFVSSTYYDQRVCFDVNARSQIGKLRMIVCLKPRCLSQKQIKPRCLNQKRSCHCSNGT